MNFKDTKFEAWLVIFVTMWKDLGLSLRNEADIEKGKLRDGEKEKVLGHDLDF